MRIFISTIIILLFSINLFSQNTISRLDISHEELTSEQLSVAVTILSAIEKNKFDLVKIYREEKLTRNDVNPILETLEKYRINTKGFPPIVKDSLDQIENQYFRVYYLNTKTKETLFAIKLVLTKNKITSVELMNGQNKNSGLSLIKYLNEIVCGNRPIGPPVARSLIDFKTGKEIRFFKQLILYGPSTSMAEDVYKYKDYILHLKFIDFPKEFFDSTTLWDYHIVSLEIMESMHEMKSLSPNIRKLKELNSLVLMLKNTEIPNQIFQLENLKKLSINSRSRMTLTANIKNLKKLERLTIRNDILSLPKEIGELKNLKRILIKSDSLGSIPKEIGNLENLTSLDLEGLFPKTPNQIGKLSNLVNLRLDSPNLIALPNSLGRLVKLSNISIENASNFESLPVEIENLSRIRKLKFDGVDTIPFLERPISNVYEIEIKNAKDVSGINKFKDIAILKIANCSIDTLVNFFHNTTRLKALIIDDCLNLEYIEKSTSKAQKMDFVKISNTKLREIPNEIFYSTDITSLIFENSNLKTIPTEISSIKNINKITLSGNNIETIPIELVQLKKCKNVYLYNNNISMIEKELIEYKTNNKMKIYLHGNPIIEKDTYKTSSLDFIF